MRWRVLRAGYSTLDFNFPDHNGKRWTPRDPSFINKVLVDTTARELVSQLYQINKRLF